jgi:hypothetical protein
MTMSIIKWLGESEHWTVPECGTEPGFIMPLTERRVLCVAGMSCQTRKLSLQAGINCTSRLAMRLALASTSLNPAWKPWEWNGPSVVKAPASSANLGVRFLESNEYIEYLKLAAPDLARFGVVEELVDGPQYEVDGFVIGSRVSCFCCLLQHWNEERDRIIGYERKEPGWSAWREAVMTSVKLLGINDCPFCVEMRYSLRHAEWRIIEVHARLGEDPGLDKLLADEYPLSVIERECRKDFLAMRAF